MGIRRDRSSFAKKHHGGLAAWTRDRKQQQRHYDGLGRSRLARGGKVTGEAYSQNNLATIGIRNN